MLTLKPSQVLNPCMFVPSSDIFKSNKIMKNFQEFLNNIFQPLFEVTNDPNTNIELHKFLSVSIYRLGITSIWRVLLLLRLSQTKHKRNLNKQNDKGDVVLTHFV